MTEEIPSVRASRSENDLNLLIDTASRSAFEDEEELIEFAFSEPVLLAVIRQAQIMAWVAVRRTNMTGIQEDLAQDLYLAYCDYIEKKSKKLLYFKEQRNSPFMLLKLVKTLIGNEATLPKSKSRLKTKKRLEDLSFDSLTDKMLNGLERAEAAENNRFASAEKQLVAVEDISEWKNALSEIMRYERQLDELTTKAAFHYLILGFPENGGNYGRKKEIADHYEIRVAQLDNRLEGMRERHRPMLEKIFSGDTVDGLGESRS